MRALSLAAVLILVTLNAGCFGYRCGEFSMPYITERPPLFAIASTPYEQRQMCYVQLSNMVFRVDLMNSITKSDTAWVCVIPILIDFKDTPMYSSNWVVEVAIKTTIEGFTFDASQILMKVNGTTRKVTAVNGRGTMLAEHMLPPGPISMKPGKQRWFYIMFDRDTPAPNEDIELDLNQAAKHPDGTIFPIIRSLQGQTCTMDFEAAVDS